MPPSTGPRDATTLWEAGTLPRCHPQKPHPLAHHATSGPLAAQPDFLTALFKRFLARLTDAERADLCAWVTIELRGVINIGTVCSGTDAPVLVWLALRQALHEACGVTLIVQHSFSCEKDERKQRFIRSVFPDVPRLYEDCCELGEAEAADVITGKRQAVPSVAALFGGFPCTDASSLNPSSATAGNRTCLQRGDKRTGSVFAGILRYVKARRDPLLFLGLENVLALAFPPRERGRIVGPDNLSVAVHLLAEECGFWTKVWSLDPRLFGVPQCRPRLWMASFPSESLRRLALSAEAADARLSDLMSRLTGSRLAQFDDYLLPETHVQVQQVAMKLEARACLREGRLADACLMRGGRMPPTQKARGQCHAPTGAERWLALHLREYDARGMKWWESAIPTDSVLTCFPGLRALQQRQFECLRLVGVTDFPERVTRTVDVSQMSGRAKLAEGFVHTLTPSGQKYITSRCRMLLGTEALRLQSLWFGEAALSPFDDSLLLNLAGNAFEGSCCAATVFSSCVLLATGAVSRAQHSIVVPRLLHCAPHTKVDESEGDSSSESDPGFGLAGPPSDALDLVWGIPAKRARQE